jgi:hypothetical protein
MWDDYEGWIYHNKDEEHWERFRDSKIYIVHNLLDFLFKLRIMKDVETHYDAAGFVDRHWKHE